MRPPRLTVARLMLMVAVVAIGIQAARLARTSAGHRSRAEDHRQEALRGRSELAKIRVSTRAVYFGEDRKEFLINYYQRHGIYHDLLFQKYRYAAWNPWVAVSPDPLPPNPFPPLHFLPPGPPMLRFDPIEGIVPIPPE